MSTSKIECHECGQKLSRTAVTCVSCGRQMRSPAAEAISKAGAVVFLGIMGTGAVMFVMYLVGMLE